MKYKILSVATLFLGLLAGFFGRPIIDDPVTASWQRINDFKAFSSDPDNWNKNGDLMDITVPDTLDVDIATLLAAGEINHRRVFIPEVPNSREYILMWMAESSDDIVQANSVGVYQDGEIPLFFEIWYKPSYESRLIELISEIKKKHMENKTQKTNL